MTPDPPTTAAVFPEPAARFLAGLRAGIAAVDLEAWPLVVGVSGGGDSVALLLGLLRIAPAAAGRLVVAHAEHDLRPAAAADREFVVALAERLGLSPAWRQLAVRDAGDGRGEGLEARARRLRYAFLADVARSAGARHVAVAHTADDQAETILHRVLRGTGVAGLAGMPRARELCPGVGLVRPLLAVSRGDVRAFLAAEGAEWREDETNADTARARNFLRHELLPRCASGPYPVAAAAVVRLGGQAGRLAAALASAAEHLLDRHADRRADGTVVVRLRPLAGLDPHLVAEVFVALWRREDWPRRDMTARHYGRLAAVAGDPAPAAPAGLPFPLPGGVEGRLLPEGLLELRPAAPPRGRSPQDDISTRL